ncbi:unnamed protein product, partial [Ixodes hexagonus]
MAPPRLQTDSDGWTNVLRKRQRPTNQQTLIIRPHDGFVLTSYRPAAIMLATRTAANLLAHETDSVYIEIQDAQNIAVARHLKDTTTAKINRITGVTLGGQLRRVCVYTMAPDNSCKGIVHGIDNGTTTEQLMQDLRAPGTEIITARMMGRTETALITFEGSYVPLYVLYHHAKYRCRPHR